MPKKPHELIFSDVAALWLDTYDELARRGMYVDASIQFVTSQRKPSSLHDVSLELRVLRRANSMLVWRAAESFRVPGRMRMRPIGNVIASLLQRAIYDIRESYPLPSDNND